MKNWEKILNALTKKCIIEDKYNAVNLYIRLSNQAADWIKNKQYDIKNGDVFYVPLENRTKLKFIFYKNTTQLELVGDTTGKSRILIDADDSAKREYRKLNELVANMKISGHGLGTSMGSSWDVFLYNLKAGDCFTCEGNHTYCCLSNQDGILKFTETYTGNIDNITKRTFDNMTIHTMNLFDMNDRQTLFATNRLDALGTVSVKLSNSTFAQEYINKLYSKLKAGQTKRLSWGKINLLVRKKKIGRGLIWYLDGEQTDEQTIKIMLNYFHNAPFETDFVRKQTDDLKSFEDNECLNAIKGFCADKKYAETFTLISNYVLANQQSLSVNIHTFAPDDEGNYISTCFAFKYEDEQVQVYKMNFIDNDFNQDIESISSIDINEFVNFCNRVNEQNKHYWIEDAIAKNQIKELTEIRKKVVSNVAELKSHNNPIINNDSIKKNVPLEDIIKGYSEAKKEDSNELVSKAKDVFERER